MAGVIELAIQYGYAVVFGAVLAQQIGLPLPSEPSLLAGGGLVGSGRRSLAIILAAAVIASLIGDTVWYWIGRTAALASWAGCAASHSNPTRACGAPRECSPPMAHGHCRSPSSCAACAPSRRRWRGPSGCRYALF